MMGELSMMWSGRRSRHRIACVSLHEMVAGYAGRKEEFRLLQRRNSRLRHEIGVMKHHFDRAVEAYESHLEDLLPEEAEKQRTYLADIQRQMQQFKEHAERVIDMEKQFLIEEVRKQIVRHIRAYQQQEGIDLIVSNPADIGQDQEVKNITGLLLTSLNRNYRVAS